jgi:hypothetical protein
VNQQYSSIFNYQNLTVSYADPPLNYSIGTYGRYYGCRANDSCKAANPDSCCVFQKVKYLGMAFDYEVATCLNSSVNWDKGCMQPSDLTTFGLPVSDDPKYLKCLRIAATFSKTCSTLNSLTYNT